MERLQGRGRPGPAHAHERAAGANRRATANSIALDAATAYWETRRAALTLDVARQALERTREIERTARVRVDAHIAPRIDYERSHVQSVRAAEAVASLSGQWTAARAELGLALQADEPLWPSDNPAALTPLLPSLERALADAPPRAPSSRRPAPPSRRSASRCAAKSGYWPQPRRRREQRARRTPPSSIHATSASSSPRRRGSS